MKVGILTFPNSVSYGATLQMYALYRTVNKLGHDAEVINYFNNYMKSEKHCNLNGASELKRRIKFTARRMLHARLYKSFRKFEKANMSLYPKKEVNSVDALPEIGSRYGAVICGSDQVWNPDITDSDLSYFLDFCGDNTRRISYAPSFGVETLSDEFSASVATELKKFHAVSVREESGRVLVKGMTGEDIPIVVDPTMLLDADDWAQTESEHPLGVGDYILYYTIHGSKSLWKFCKKLSAETGMKIVSVGGNAISNFKNKDPDVEYAVDISPSEWLYLLHRARYVVTNSFHGTAFSINYRKDFYVEFSSATNSRLEHITKMLDLRSRIVREEMAAASERCDYTVTEKLLPELRANSLSYLKNALCEDLING